LVTSFKGFFRLIKNSRLKLYIVVINALPS
jgi:hypothetical protein